MAALAFLVLILAMAGHSSANWCVCKSGISEKELQKTLDYACGAGADCNPTHSGGACFNPNTVQAHCSYAVNSYFQKKGQAQGTCDFSGTATVVTSDPSTSSTCAYPATASATSIGTTPITTTPSSTTTTTTGTPSTATPYSTTTPSNGVLGGIGNGMGPSGINDESNGIRLTSHSLFSSSMTTTLFLSGLMLWWA
ncbi:hypothetical protein L484_004704 [Morus notabilis]|uniref:X8 domain-containing protein n=1 Tax=Morus notabilis TaxID=981085 RepID=W9S0H2_9ROSA|nr:PLASMODESMATA CALLOSE-BINDING PROTEIN 3 [Morus notabilis]EXC06420.1 hypothetical protein L484_004704 [Morus notabilis]